jgi:hypothetical protein
MNDTIKDIGNALYKGGLLAFATLGSRYVTKSMGFKDRPIEFKAKSLAMLAVDISAGTYVVQKLQDNNTIPNNIFT